MSREHATTTGKVVVVLTIAGLLGGALAVGLWLSGLARAEAVFIGGCSLAALPFAQAVRATARE